MATVIKDMEDIHGLAKKEADLPEIYPYLELDTSGEDFMTEEDFKKLLRMI